jgi:hypothetical protein
LCFFISSNRAQPMTRNNFLKVIETTALPSKVI